MRNIFLLKFIFLFTTMSYASEFNGKMVCEDKKNIYKLEFYLNVKKVVEKIEKKSYCVVSGEEYYDPYDNEYRTDCLKWHISSFKAYYYEASFKFYTKGRKYRGSGQVRFSEGSSMTASFYVRELDALLSINGIYYGGENHFETFPYSTGRDGLYISPNWVDFNAPFGERFYLDCRGLYWPSLSLIK